MKFKKKKSKPKKENKPKLKPSCYPVHSQPIPERTHCYPMYLQMLSKSYSALKVNKMLLLVTNLYLTAVLLLCYLIDYFSYLKIAS